MINRVVWVIGLFILSIVVFGAVFLLAIKIWVGDSSKSAPWQGCQSGLCGFVRNILKE